MRRACQAACLEGGFSARRRWLWTPGLHLLWRPCPRARWWTVYWGTVMTVYVFFDVNLTWFWVQQFRPSPAGSKPNQGLSLTPVNCMETAVTRLEKTVVQQIVQGPRHSKCPGFLSKSLHPSYHDWSSVTWRDARGRSCRQRAAVPPPTIGGKGASGDTSTGLAGTVWRGTGSWWGRSQPTSAATADWS